MICSPNVCENVINLIHSVLTNVLKPSKIDKLCI